MHPKILDFPTSETPTRAILTQDSIKSELFIISCSVSIEQAEPLNIQIQIVIQIQFYHIQYLQFCHHIPQMAQEKKMNQDKKNMVKAILENLERHFDKYQDLLSKVLKNLEEKSEIQQIKNISTHPEIGKVFIEQINEFGSWSEAYKLLVKQTGKQQLKNKDFDQILIKIQPKIKLSMSDDLDLKEIHKAYFQQITINMKKIGLNLSRQQIASLKAKKQEIKKKKLDSQAKKERARRQQNRQEPNREEPKEVSKQKNGGQSKVSEKKEDKPVSRQQRDPEVTSKKNTQRKKEDVKTVLSVESRNNANAIEHFLNSKDQYYLTQKKQISNFLAKKLKQFMKKKIEEVIHYSKLKQISYNSNEGGDEFRYYSKYNTSYETNSIERIPVTDFKIYQVRYPSKLTQNNDLRIIQEEKQEYLRNQAKKKLQGDKKSDKFFQNYTLDDPKWIKTQAKMDQYKLKQVERLKIDQQCVKYTIENDPWFCDSVLMERTFYK